MASSVTLCVFLVILCAVDVDVRSQECGKQEELRAAKRGSVEARLEMLEDIVQTIKTDLAEMRNQSQETTGDGNASCAGSATCPPCPAVTGHTDCPDFSSVTCPCCPADVVNVTCPTCAETTCPTPSEELELSLLKDCSDVLEMGQKNSVVYTIHLNRSSAELLDVFCDMETDGGGWTVFQRRDDFGEPREDFDRNWTDYKEGFGDVTKEFWLGNDALHVLTNQEPMRLRVDMEDWKGRRGFAAYSDFKVGSERDKYNVSFWGFSGNVSDSFVHLKGMRFSTRDRDNDRLDVNCAQRHKGGWWYNACGYSRLNGVYYVGGKYLAADPDGVVWFDWIRKDEWYSLKVTEMKIRPMRFDP